MSDMIFSEEERREINARIEEASRRGDHGPVAMPAKGETLRRGLFPLLVNIAAAALLALGLAVIFFSQRGENSTILESGAVLGITERALIREIRKETSLRISEKEAAIAAMSAKLAGVDAELSQLDSLEALSDEQRAAMAGLRSQQDEYRLSLAGLQTERAGILAEARRKEADLYAKLEEQKGALENLSSRSSSEIQAARDELARLSGDQEKAALVARQLNAYFSAAERQIQAAQYKEASETLAALREFLATPSFQPLKNIQARRESDLAALGALQFMLDSLKTERPPAAEAQSQTAALEGAMPDEKAPGQVETALRRQMEELNKSNTEQTAKITELQNNLGDLQKNVRDLQSKTEADQRTIAERDRQINSLREVNRTNAQLIDTQQKTIATLQEELDKQ